MEDVDWAVGDRFGGVVRMSDGFSWVDLDGFADVERDTGESPRPVLAGRAPSSWTSSVTSRAAERAGDSAGAARHTRVGILLPARRRRYSARDEHQQPATGDEEPPRT
jgi:hypothetical protein